MGLKDVHDSFGFEHNYTFSGSPTSNTAIPKNLMARIAKESLAAVNLAGKYQAVEGHSLLFDIVDDQTIRYSIKIVKPCMGKKKLACCTGELYGLIFTGANPARSIHYTKEYGQCILTFFLSKHEVIVSEENCLSWHGLSCRFDGVYQKQ